MKDILGDILEQDEAAPSEDALGRLVALATDLIAADAEVERLEAELKVAKEHSRELSEKRLPDAMLDINVKEFVLGTGERVEIKDILEVRIPKEKQARALEWLRANGHGGIIKNVLKASFGKGESSKAATALKLLAQANITASLEESVHSSTLGAFARELKEQGEMLPEEGFSVWEGRRAKVVI